MSSSYSNLFATVNLPVLTGLIGLGITWLLTLFGKKIWVYAFIAILVLSFFPFLSISQISFSLSFGSFDLNLFTLALFIAHLVLNFSDEPKQLPPTPEGGWTKVNWLKHEHQDKTDEEIESMLKEELAPELRQALEELLASREKQ